MKATPGAGRVQVPRANRSAAPNARGHARATNRRRGIAWPVLMVLAPILAIAPAPVGAKPVNVEFRFTPYLPGAKDGAMPYRSQFRSMVVDDKTTTSTTAMGSLLTTNLGARGGEDREARGPVAVQQAFQALFARVEPWQDAPAVTALSPDERAAILELVRRRADLFAPDFSAAYRHLASLPKDRGVSLDVPEARRLGCPEAG